MVESSTSLGSRSPPARCRARPAAPERDRGNRPAQRAQHSGPVRPQGLRARCGARLRRRLGIDPTPARRRARRLSVDVPLASSARGRAPPGRRCRRRSARRRAGDAVRRPAAVAAAFRTLGPARGETPGPARHLTSAGGGYTPSADPHAGAGAAATGRLAALRSDASGMPGCVHWRASASSKKGACDDSSNISSSACGTARRSGSRKRVEMITSRARRDVGGRFDSRELRKSVVGDHGIGVIDEAGRRFASGERERTRRGSR